MVKLSTTEKKSVAFLFWDIFMKKTPNDTLHKCKTIPRITWSGVAMTHKWVAIAYVVGIFIALPLLVIVIS